MLVGGRSCRLLLRLVAHGAQDFWYNLNRYKSTKGRHPGHLEHGAPCVHSGLKIFYGDRIEDLAAHLRARLRVARANGDPFVFSQVVVPNTNIAKWLQIRVFAKEQALCAGIKFPFVEQRLTELMSANLPDGTPFSLLPDHAYANAIMSALLATQETLPEFDALAPFRAYIANGEGGDALRVSTQRQARMAWQLALKMADLMDQYEVRRPEIVANWLKGLSADGGEKTASAVEAAEAALARMLWGKQGVFPADGENLSLRQLFDRVCATPPKGPAQTIYFFGHSTLSLLQVKILAWLAQTHEVVFYHNNVCLEYWGDIESKAERLRRLGKAHADEEDVSVENPLLQQWGVAGRETMRLLVELEEENDGRIDFEWTCVDGSAHVRPDTVLGRIQESICHRTGEVEKVPQDASLQVVGVPGIRREVEMVYNAILGSVWKPKDSGTRPWPDCSFSDIAVLVPDMGKYRPVIEAVFDARGDVPYGLIDTTASEDSKFLAGFLALADMARHGLTRETLFAVLENPCVQKALGFSGADVANWRDLTAAIGAFDGFEDRAGESKFNWDWALSRLRLARVADALKVVGEPDVDLPLVGEGGNGALQFSEIVELLYRKMEAVFGDGTRRRLLPCAIALSDGARWKPNWAHALTKLMNDFLAVPDDHPLEGNVQRQIVQTLDGLASLPGAQDCEIVLAAVEQFVDGIACRRGGYLTHGVTIAGLQPMRPVPFRQVFVLGLGANGFPGRTSSTTLDVRGAGWRLGDTSVPKVNRYLFLETVMSARDRLVLSYQNRDIEKDEELFPAGIVRELEDFAGEAIIGTPFAEFENYPLLERGEAADATGGAHLSQSNISPVCDVMWNPNDPEAGILPTYSKVARRMARDRMGVSAATGEPAGAQEQVSSVAHREVSARELAEFLKSPLNAVLRCQLGIGVEGYRDNELDVDSPLGVPGGPSTWELEGTILDGDGGLDGLFRQMQLAGQLPMGFLGAFAKERFSANVLAFADELRRFAAEFGVHEGVDLTARQRVPATVRSTDGTATKVQYVAETPNWVETEDGVSVLVTGWLLAQGGKDLPINARPIDRTLAPFMAFLMSLASNSVVDADVPRALRIGVIDFTNGKTAVWKWRISPKEARTYLERLTARYWAFLGSVQRPSAYVDFTYKKLARALEPDSGGDWDAILERLTAEDWNSGAKSGFSSGLVVEDAVAAYRCDPTAEELQRLYEEFYRLPMSGVKEAEGNGGAA